MEQAGSCRKLTRKGGTAERHCSFTCTLYTKHAPQPPILGGDQDNVQHVAGPMQSIEKQSAAHLHVHQPFVRRDVPPVAVVQPVPHPVCAPVINKGVGGCVVPAVAAVAAHAGHASVKPYNNNICTSEAT